MAIIFIKEKRGRYEYGDTEETYKEESHGKMEAEIEVMHL